MAATWASTITAWQSASPSASGSFNPAAGSCILLVGIDANVTTATITAAGTGSYSTVLTSQSDTKGDTWAAFANTNATTGAQTATISSNTAGHIMVNFGQVYTNVANITTSFVVRTTPGTGSGAITGSAVTVPVGAVLIALCCDVTGGTSAISSPTGTNRAAGFNGGDVEYCWTEYAGTGASVTPTFTCATGGTSSFPVVQFILTASVLALTGLAITSSGGTLAPSNSVPLTGLATTSSQGILTPNFSLPLVGQSITSSKGTLTPNTSLSLSGLAITSGLGTLSPSTVVRLNGQTIIARGGVLTPSGGNVQPSARNLQINLGLSLSRLGGK